MGVWRPVADISRLYYSRENGALGSLASGRAAGIRSQGRKILRLCCVDRFSLHVKADIVRWLMRICQDFITARPMTVID